MTMTLIIIGVWYVLVGIWVYAVIDWFGIGDEIEFFIDSIKMHFMEEITEEEYNKLFK